MPTCKTCHQTVDSKAPFCPNCGRPEPGKPTLRIGQWVVIFIFVIFALGYCSSNDKKSSQAPSATPTTTETTAPSPPEEAPKTDQTTQPVNNDNAQTLNASENALSQSGTTSINETPPTVPENSELPQKYHFEADLQDANGGRSHVRLDATNEDEARKIIKTLGNPEILSLQQTP